MNTPIETHPLAPFIPKNARLLLRGTPPPPRSRWKMDFYYPNLQNDMWRIFGLIYHGDRKHFLAADGKGFREIALREFLAKHGIAISDTACSVRRLQGNAADKSPAPTGALAPTTLIEQCPAGTPVPRIGSSIAITLAERSLQLYRLPSTSRAYPLKLENKAAVYRDCLVTCGLLK